jgi:hypothetical protein
MTIQKYSKSFALAALVVFAGVFASSNFAIAEPNGGPNSGPDQCKASTQTVTDPTDPTKQLKTDPNNPTPIYGTWVPDGPLATDKTTFGGTCQYLMPTNTGTSKPATSGGFASTVKDKAGCDAAGGTWKSVGRLSDGTPYGEYCEGAKDLTGVAATNAAGTVPVATAKEDPLTADDKCDTGDKGTNIDGSNCKIIAYLNTAFNFATGLIGLAVTGNIIWAGIQYSMAQGEPGKAQKAKERIRGAVVALLMYFALSGFMEWLIPGGVF